MVTSSITAPSETPGPIENKSLEKDLKSIGVGVDGSFYDLCTKVQEPYGGWFSLWDCCNRTARTILAFYYLLLTHPMSFLLFSFRYNSLWYGGWIGGIFSVMSIFAWPGIVAFLRLAILLNKKISGAKEFDDGNVFFIAPDNCIASLLWDFYKEFSVYISSFIMFGSDPTGIQHSWYDYITQKDFWRRHLEQVGAKIPYKQADWNGASPCKWLKDADKAGDVVIKLQDSYLGIGDEFLAEGETDGYDGSREAVEKILDAKFAGKEGTFVLDWIRPAKGHEVHSLDIVTILRPGGKVEVLTCLYWGSCADGKSTHSSKAGYICDVETETIKAPAAWYSAYFANHMAAALGEKKPGQADIGTILPGLANICRMAVKAHKSVAEEQPWLKMCGWDAIIAKQGSIFFEGNFACHRIPRRIFLTWTNTFRFLAEYKPASLPQFLSRKLHQC